MTSVADGPGDLQFETVSPQTEAPVGLPSLSGSPGVTCVGCQRTLDSEYFDVNGKSVCTACRDELACHAETPRGWGPLAMGLAYGIVAAILGAILYYAVIAITNIEIGIVAIAIGYMVGYGVRRGTGGRGGRRFQIAALILTYWAVGLAYTPLAFRDMTQKDEQSAAATANAGNAAPVVTQDGAAAAQDGAEGRPNAALALLVLAGITFVLPVLIVAGSMPSGLISAAIIGFGMRQAWLMTGAPQLVITGPYRIGSSTPVATP